MREGFSWSRWIRGRGALVRPFHTGVVHAVLAVTAALRFVPAVRAQEEGVLSRIQVVGFTNVDYQFTEEGNEEADGFRHGEVSMLIVAPLGSRLNFFSEISAAAHEGGGHGGGASLSFAVMRALLRYDFTDFFKLSVGRYHPPLGYWPVAFNHGVWLETTVGTPLMFNRHDGFLPGHFLGVLAEGKLPVTTLGLGYTIGIGNGRDLNLADPGDAGDANRQRAGMINVRLRPPNLLGLEIGGTFYVDRVSPSPSWEWDERMVSAHVVWEKERPEFLAEYARIVHDRVGADSKGTSEAYYVQLAYRLPGRLQALKPYVRLERIDIPRADSILRPLALNYEAGIAGVRYDFAPVAAVKAEYRSERFEDESSERFSSLIMQVSLTFGAGEAPSLATAGEGLRAQETSASTGRRSYGELR